jgi:hypothetical protein
MTTGDSYQTSFLKLIAALCLLWTTAVQAQGFSEPPRVIHGKVVKLGQGGGYQLFSCTMHVKLINKQNAAHVLEVDIPLRMAGANGEFSYRFEIDQETAPSSDKLADTLVVGTGALTYTIHSVTINGYAASLLAPPTS